MLGHIIPELSIGDKVFIVRSRPVYSRCKMCEGTGHVLISPMKTKAQAIQYKCPRCGGSKRLNTTGNVQYHIEEDTIVGFAFQQYKRMYGTGELILNISLAGQSSYNSATANMVFTSEATAQKLADKLNKAKK